MDWFLNDRDIRHERVNTAAEMTSNEARNNGFVDSDNLCLLFVLTSNGHYNSRSIIELYSEPCQTKKMERFVIIVNSFYPFTISANLLS